MPCMAMLVLAGPDVGGYNIIASPPGSFRNGPGDEATCRYISLIPRLSLSSFFGAYEIRAGEKVRNREGEPGNKAEFI